MLGAFDGPVAHLAFDDAWLGALAAFGERLGEDSATACWWAVAMLWGGKSRVRAGAAARGAEACGERQSVGGEVGGERGVVHQPADRVVGAQVAVGFLVDAVRVL